MILYEFYSMSCAPCRKIAPVVEKLARENGVDLIKVDVEELPSIVAKFGVRSVPTLILTDMSKELRRLVGGVSEAKIRSFLLG